MKVTFDKPVKNEYEIPFCERMEEENDYLYRIEHVPFKLVVSSWKRFLDGHQDCTILIETEDDSPFVRECGVDVNRINICGNKTYDFNLSFLIDRHAVHGERDNLSIKYKIKLQNCKSGKVIAMDNGRLDLILVDCCPECQIFYKQDFCTIIPVLESIVYSDKNRTDSALHIVDLNIAGPIDGNSLYPQELTLVCNVQVGADRECRELEVDFTGEFPKRIPLCVDMHNFSCPESESQLNITVSCAAQQNPLCEAIAIESQLSIPYKRAPEYNLLGVFFKDGNGDEIPVRSKEVYEFSHIPVLKAMGQIGDTIIKKNIVLRNLSSCAESMLEFSGVHIRNLKVGVVSDDLDRIEGMSEEEARMEWAYAHAQEIILRANGSHEIPIKFNLDKIGNIRVKNHKRELSWKLAISFEYWEDRYSYTQNVLGNTAVDLQTPMSDWKSFQAVLSTCIHRSVPVCYYSVDLGTSAVVAYKMARNVINGFENPSLIDLKTIKNNLLLAQYPDDPVKKIDNSKKREDNSEEENSIIASTLYLNSTSIKSNEFDFKNLLLWFSPSSGMTHPDYMYPCLKYMMGQRNVPKIPKLQNRNFDPKSRDVEFVIQTVYEQLSKLYLNTSESPIESLVLTVPNSFTPVHIEKIHNAIMDNVESLSEEMLEFVSESDAVLCSYIMDTKDDGDLVRKRKTEDGEHILIYDMGAGTLDVTYAKCNIKADGGITIDIIARTGLNRAGDYIDYLLGEILSELLFARYSSENNKILPEAFARGMSIVPSKNTEYKDKKNLKDYLRNKVKRELKKSNAKHCMPPADINGKYEYRLLGNYPPLNELGNITIGDVLGNPKFLSYIQSCTEDVIAGLTNSYGKDMGLGTKRLIIDTVVLSGRTTSLEAISEALRKSITNHIPQNRNIAYREVSGNDTLNQKTVVAKGALDYIRLKGDGIKIIKKMIYGSYGLILKHPQNDVWHPLMSEVNEKPGSIELKLDLNGVSEILLVHSYSASPLIDTNRTVLHRVQVPLEWVGTSKKVIFHIDGNMMMKYSISEIDGTNVTNYPLESHDDYYNEDLRKSLWPVIYN